MKAHFWTGILGWVVVGGMLQASADHTAGHAEHTEPPAFGRPSFIGATLRNTHKNAEQGWKLPLVLFPKHRKDEQAPFQAIEFQDGRLPVRLIQPEELLKQ